MAITPIVNILPTNRISLRSLCSGRRPPDDKVTVVTRNDGIFVATYEARSGVGNTVQAALEAPVASMNANNRLVEVYLDGTELGE